MIVLTIFSVFLANKVKINYDMAQYLPDTSLTRQGMDIMNEEFSDYQTSSLNLMFQDLKKEEIDEIILYLENIDGVSEVLYDESEDYNKDNYTLFTLTVDDKKDSLKASEVFSEIEDHFKDYTYYTSGDIAQTNGEVLPIWIVLLAIFCALIILIIMCESYVEPFLFLTAILMAVLLNNGTNIIFSNVSNITKSISAILQLALSMDYSIMLISRYEQEKEKYKDKVEAMKEALHHAFQAISSSSVTTIAGLLALVFMSFTIGKDLGLVLAKGVLFSLVCIFLVLPTLILMCDKLIVKTKKKTPVFKMDKIGKASYKMRYIALPLFLVACVGSYVLKGNLGFFYTNSEEDKISQVFQENNQMAIIYQNKDEDIIKKYLDQIDDDRLVDEVLAYGNTIDEDLTYDKLMDKVKDLGSDMDIADYLLQILYYNYYNKDINVKISLSEFINFIEDKAYNNEDLKDKIDKDMKNNIERLKNFSTKNNVNKKRTISDLASILEIDKSNVEDLMIYYLAINKNAKLSINDFVEFMDKDVLTSKKYGEKIDEEQRERIDKLKKFINKEDIIKKLDYKEMASLFAIDEMAVKDLYKYYISLSDIDLKLSINQFANFVVKNVMNNEEYEDMFDREMKDSIQLLKTFSDRGTITKDMGALELSRYLNVPEDMIKQLLLLKYKDIDDGSTFSLDEFILGSEKLVENEYIKESDISLLEMLKPFVENKDGIDNKEMNKDELKGVFDKLAPGLVDMVYDLPGKDGVKFSPKTFIETVLSFAESGGLDEATINKLKILQLAIDSGLADNPPKFSATQMAETLGLSKSDACNMYALINYYGGNTNNWTASLSELVNLIIANKENSLIKDKIDGATWSNLGFLKDIMDSTLDNDKFSYDELGRYLGIDEKMVKDIYTLYIDNRGDTVISPINFVTFILEHKDDEVLEGKLDEETLSDLDLVKQVMEGVIGEVKYSSKDLATLSSVNEDDLKLLYGLYDYKYLDKNYKVSLKEFINYLLNEVVSDKEYGKEFSKDKISKLQALREIIKGVDNGAKYTHEGIYKLVEKLTEDIDKNTIDILYIYYGSQYKYDYNYVLTIEEFVQYLNKDILNDERFNEFIDDEMREEIREAKTKISDAKNLIRGKNYSRIVLNTKYEKEGKNTFKFIENLRDKLSEGMDKFYVIGDSPMAYDMSKTFNQELTYITIITMIVIFVVVAFTFKSLIIPVILVLVIQCAVYLTMGILSLMGDNVYFIAILIVQSILMGATIDYAILYTSYYLELRRTMEVKDAVIEAYNESIHTIITSASILIIVTLIVGYFASAIASKICITISQGTLCSVLLILILLPAVLASLDKIIVKQKKME